MNKSFDVTFYCSIGKRSRVFLQTQSAELVSLMYNEFIFWGLQLEWMRKQVDIRDPYQSDYGPEWDAMTMDSFLKQKLWTIGKTI